MNLVVTRRPILAARPFHVKWKCMAVLPRIVSLELLVRRRTLWVENGLLE